MTEPVRDLGRAIYDEITTDEPDGYVDAALTMWNGCPDDGPHERMQRVLCFVAAAAIDKVLDQHGTSLGPWWHEKDDAP